MLVFLLGFSGVSSLLVYFRRVSSLLCISAESRHCFVFLLGFSCQQNQDELALFLVLSVCVIEFLGHVERMTDEIKRDHNAASLFEFGGAMNDWCDPAQSALL